MVVSRIYKRHAFVTISKKHIYCRESEIAERAVYFEYCSFILQFAHFRANLYSTVGNCVKEEIVYDLCVHSSDGNLR